jgi:hypothetical protein
MYRKLSASLTFITENLTSILIGILTLFVGLNGVLFDIRKKPEAKTSFKNTSGLGRFFILTIFVLGGITMHQQFQGKQQSADDKIKLDKDLKIVKMELKKAKAQQIELTEITMEIGKVSEKTVEVVFETQDLAENIEEISTKTGETTDNNRVLLGSMNVRSVNSVKHQSQLLLNINELKLALANQGSRIDKMLEKNEIKEADLVKKIRFAHVTFDYITVAENCEKTPGNQGEFYYDFYANGHRLINPLYTLSSPLKLSDNSRSQALGKIMNIEIVDIDDTISLNGYIRERDQKNILLRWTYEYDGVFSKSLMVSQKQDTIHVIDYPKCNVKLSVSISTSKKRI